MSEITISNPRHIGKNTLIGAADVELPIGLVIRSVMLHQKNNKRWLLFSSKEWLKNDGTRGYSPLLEFASPEVSDRFRARVLPLIETALNLPPLAAGAGDDR